MTNTERVESIQRKIDCHEGGIDVHENCGADLKFLLDRVQKLEKLAQYADELIDPESCDFWQGWQVMMKEAGL